MRRRPREPRRAAALLAALALAACSPRGEPAASPPATASSPPATASPSPAASTPPATVEPPAGRSYVIGVLGDYGVDAPAVRQVVRAMGRFNGGRPLDAVVTTGDNAYCCGSAAQSAFAWRMLAPLRPAPVYAALGNHDVQTRDGATFMRAFGMRQRWYTARVGPVEVVVLDSTRVSDPRQLAFLKGVLARPRAGAFRVVAFHHPAWSCSAHGPDETSARTRWLPLFGDEVDLVLAGHNHTYERFTGTGGTPYVTTGGGGAQLYPSARPACRGAGDYAFLRTVHHAVRLVATERSLRLEAVGVDGAAFDSVTIAPRRP